MKIDFKLKLEKELETFQRLERELVSMLKKNGVKGYDIDWNNEVRRYRKNIRELKETISLYYD